MKKMNLLFLVGLAISLVAVGCSEQAPTGLGKPAAGEKLGPLQKLGAHVVPISSSLQLVAISTLGGTTVTDTDGANQGATIDPLSASVSALVTSGNASILTTGAGLARWHNAAEGRVGLGDMGWETANVQSGSANLFNGSDWTYTFTSLLSGIFTLNFEVTAEGSSTFGLNGFNFLWSGGPGGNDFFFINTSGTITRQIAQGNTFTVNIRNQANISGGLGTRNARMRGRFAWRITPTD